MTISSPGVDKSTQRKFSSQNSIEKQLKSQIQNSGPLSVARYMQACLHHYYTSKLPIGSQGDFTTAPETSQMFGELIGVWLQDLWQRMGASKKVHLLELGPGRGTLMSDLLRIVGADFKQALCVHFLEINPILTKLQRQKLKGIDVTWHTEIHKALAVCQNAPLFVVANEFFDALPIHQLVRRGGGWSERCVDWDQEKDTFYITEGNADRNLTLPKRHDVQEGEVIEISPVSVQIFHHLVEAIHQQRGAVLTIDYGYQMPGVGSTLQAVAQHQYSDPLCNPGESDLTAHVDFLTLKDTALQQGVQTWGPITQGRFLKDLGIELRAETLMYRATHKQREEIIQAVHRLTDPCQMGSLFKVLAITNSNLPVPSGFDLCLNQIS